MPLCDVKVINTGKSFLKARAVRECAAVLKKRSSVRVTDSHWKKIKIDLRRSE